MSEIIHDLIVTVIPSATTIAVALINRKRKSRQKMVLRNAKQSKTKRG
jgi:hypothetical protein